MTAEGHHALQQAVVERGVALELHRAQPVARAAGVDQADVGNALGRIDAQAVRDETAIEEAVAQRLVGDQPPGVVVGAVIEYRAGLQPRAGRQAEGRQCRGLAVDADFHLAQAHRLAGRDIQNQPRLLALAAHLAADLGAVMPERLQRLARLAFGMAGETPQRRSIALAQRADVRLDIVLQALAGRRQAHLQLGGGQRAADQAGGQQQAGPVAMGALGHGGDASTQGRRAGQTLQVQRAQNSVSPAWMPQPLSQKGQPLRQRA